MCECPIGLFDSGVGGLSILRAIRTMLPHEEVIYVADSMAVPYGDKPEGFIIDRVQKLVAFMLGKGVKAIVVACNTASTVALDVLQSHSTVPVVATEPTLKKAAVVTTCGVIGVLATSRTLASRRFATLVDQYCGRLTVVAQPCPGLVDQVEKGDLDSRTTRQLVATYVKPLLNRGVDTIVLGCTHYPFLKHLIEEMVGPEVAIVEPSSDVASRVELAPIQWTPNMKISRLREGV